MPVIVDRALQARALSALEPEWEARFEPRSYGFRPGRGCHDAIEAIFNAVGGKNPHRRWILDADLAAAFDRIDHDRLLRTGASDGGASSSASVVVTAVDSAAETARASSSSSRAITRRSSSISAASNASANRATSSRKPSTRTRAAASRSSSIPSTDATAHPSIMKRTQDVATPPSTRAKPCLTRRNQRITFG
ncbi:reverse transcriptase (RNA-dependent DNA polymerase) [Streptomyces sp. Ag109_O5-1]|nr:reverse transcriptase (RNA-dependent DNA polymerase) [Streptomyces sp. Ag109_O5-1]